MPGDNASSTVCHTHNSSKNYRISALANIWGNYHCFTCKNTPHLHKIGTRYPFLVSSSILNNWQGLRIMNGYQGDKIHVDYITIPGATVKELEHPFLAEYSNVHRTLDVLLVGLLNDVLCGATDSDIMEDICHFRNSVKSISAGTGDIYQGYFATATLLFPSRITVIEKDHRRMVDNRRRSNGFPHLPD